MEVYNCDYVCGKIARLLIKAGFAIDATSDVCHEQILTALSEYEAKYNYMLEHIMMQKSR